MKIDYNIKPSICFIVDEHIDTTIIASIGYGIEEEGIPFTITYQQGTDALLMAKQASKQSSLLVGIGMTTSEVVLHYRNLGEMLFLYKITDYAQKDKQVLRIFGTNAARMVKGIAFKAYPDLEVSF